MTVLFVTHDIDESVYLGERIIVLTRGPARVRETLTVDLPKPRDQTGTRGRAEFARLRTVVQRAIKEEAGGTPRI